MKEFVLRIAGNTEAPCYFTIKSKGYSVGMWSKLTNANGDDCRWTVEARKGNYIFSASNMQQLLGLISMWEVRGDNWRLSEDEKDAYIAIKEKSPLYDIDGYEVIE
ncbi:hypothetical protein [Mixta intestinalis]|uniref:Uncharacterized protein n=1 Tax=Mixta intestinalis TaxID=1615494 RepID=A0A6P1PWU1_9GAMM|nr:hypothetical protein [Mixta intestinalis]QHM70986.1 hypothetical protein C7M51_01268 [Mixta intestinalis]